jgi:uncharacterized phage protein gp47/JayE
MTVPSNDSTCGCCAGVAPATPIVVTNRPGLSAIATRIGVYESFFESLVAGLSSEERPALAALTARASDDFSISLLDAFAVVADVLTFYQERYAQENYLRTATERLSILELARLVGYELNPGLAASTPLAFTLDETAGSPAQLDLAAGVKAQSVPGPNEQPQTFETVETLQARPEWSALTPRLTQVHAPAPHDPELWLAGANLNLKEGDALVVVGDEKLNNPNSEKWDFRRIESVFADPQRNVTRVQLAVPLAPVSPPEFTASLPKVFVFRRQASLFGYNAPLWASLPKAQRIGEFVYDPTNGNRFEFGPYYNQQNFWNDRPLPAHDPQINLDAIYAQIAKDSWIVLTHEGATAKPRTQLYRVTAVAEQNVARYSLTGRTTLLTIAGKHTEWFSPKLATAFVQSEELPLAEWPILAPLDRGFVELDRRVAGLQRGRKLIVGGKRARVSVGAVAPGSLVLVAADGATRAMRRGDQFFVMACPDGALTSGPAILTLQAADGFTGTVTASKDQLSFTPSLKSDPLIAEAVVLDRVDDSDLLHTKLYFVTPLVNRYDRASVTVYGNVAAATHGETVSEVLGGGDAAATFQNFQLRQPPLTFVPAPTPSGAASTLQILVNDIAWSEADTLYAQGPVAKSFMTRRDDAGNTRVQFGDGVTYGARPPSGVANVRARYRRGLGAAGNVAAGALTTLLSRPLGLKAAVNPLPATGGADPQPLEAARVGAPRSVMTLDRAVSLGDYEAFARGFAGVSKALAAWEWDGAARRVALTLAGPGGAAVPPKGDVARNLASALGRFADPTAPFLLRSYVPATFRLGLRIHVKTQERFEMTRADVEAALRQAFGFDAREFGQAVTLSEVLAAAQAVDNVAACQVTALYRAGQARGVNVRLAAAGAQSGGAAEILTLDPRPLVELGVMP